MPPVVIPFLWINPARGRPAAYFRRGAVLVRVRDAAGKPLLPDDPGFLTAFDALRARFTAAPVVAATDAPLPGSLAALIVAYRSSQTWRDLAPATQVDYAKALDPLRDRLGALLVKNVTRALVFELRDQYATGKDGNPTPRRANRMITTLHMLLKWGVDRGWRTDNPADSTGKLQTGPGYAMWSPAEFRRFMWSADVPEPLKRAAALGYYTGQRKQDCLSADWTQREDGGLSFQPAKTKRRTAARVWVPEDPELTVILDALPLPPNRTILTRDDGQPWKEDHFNHAFAAAVKTAGLPAGHGFHGLRKALSARLAEGGATDAEMDALVYHADPGMTRMYRAGADQRKLAKSAMAKLAARGTS